MTRFANDSSRRHPSHQDTTSQRLWRRQIVVVTLGWLLAGMLVCGHAQTVQPLPIGTNAGGIVAAIAAQSDGSVVVGGLFSSINNVPRNNIARLKPDGSVDMTWNPNADQEVRALAVSASTIYVGGNFSSIGGQPRAFLAAIDANSGQATGWNPAPNLPSVEALAISDDRNTVYAGGFFTQIGALPRNYIAAIDAASGVATSWNPGTNGYVRGLTLNGNVLYAIGNFTLVAGQARTQIARFNGDGTLDATWNPAPDNAAVKALVVTAGTAFVGGQFLHIGGQPYAYLAALDASAGSSGASLPWNPVSHSDVYAIAVAGSVVYVGGTFAQIGGQTRANIAAIDASSGLATGWNPMAGGTVVYTIAVVGARVYVAGDFTTMAGQSRSGLAALGLAASTTVPGAPTIGAASAIGKDHATISFAPPADNGGSAIISYTVSCTASSIATTVASGSASPITITGLTYLATYACSVQANNAVGSSLPSATIDFTPGDLIFSDGFDGS